MYFSYTSSHTQEGHLLTESEMIQDILVSVSWQPRVTQNRRITKK